MEVRTCWLEIGNSARNGSYSRTITLVWVTFAKIYNSQFFLENNQPFNYMILDNFKDLQYEQVLVEQSESAVRQTDSCMSVNQSATNTTSYQPVRESINRRAISLIHPSHGLSSFLSVCPLSFDTLWSLRFSVSFTQSAVSLPSICAFVCAEVCRRVLWSRRWNSSFIKKR